MYLLKNYRNYIPLLSMIMLLIFLGLYLNTDVLDRHDWTEIPVIILPLILIPILNIISMVLNTHKLKSGKKLYISILVSYLVQLLFVLSLTLNADDIGIVIIQAYCVFLGIIDVISFVYPWIIYPNKKH